MKLTQNKSFLTRSASALLCLAMTSCTTAQSPSPQGATASGPVGVTLGSTQQLLSELRSGVMMEGQTQTPGAGQTVIHTRGGIQGLSPRLQKMVQRARQEMESPNYQQQVRLGNQAAVSGFMTQNIRSGNPRMFGTGTTVAGATNIIYEINTTDYSLSELATLPSWMGSAFGMAKDPKTGLIYSLSSVRDSSNSFRLARWEEGGGGFEFAGRFPAGSGTSAPKMGFSRDGELFVSTPQALFKIDHTKTPDVNDTSTYAIAAVDQNIANWSTVTGEATGGDLAFSYDGRLIMAAGKSVYEVDLAGKTVAKLADIATVDNIASLGFSPDDKLWVGDYNGTGPVTHLYEVSLEDYSVTNLTTYPSGQSLYDMSSSQWHNCPSTSAGRPTVPTSLFNNNFASYSGLPNFANLPGETQPDVSSGWKQWNGDYFPAGLGVVLHNPGAYDISPGGIDDPANDILGKRNFPGEYNTDRPNLLETSVAKSAELHYTQGDRVKAKLNTSPTFTHGDSDTTLMICFDDPAQTVVVSSTLRGNQVKGSELLVDVEIPACATTATVIAMGYLGETEASSVTFEKASLEFVPAGYYTKTTLLDAKFDSSSTHATYGDNFPSDFDEQFGDYDFYTVDNFPVVAGDTAITAGNPDSSAAYGGLVKQVDLPALTATDSLSAKMYLASTFSNPASEASMLVDFFDASDTKLGSVNAQKVNATQYRWIEIDRAAIPAGATYIKVVPIIKLGANETGSFLMDNLKVELNRTP